MKKGVFYQKRCLSATVELVVLTFELLQIVLYLRFHVNLLLLSAADLLLLSPLKAGRAFFYDCLAEDGSDTKFRYLFRYYRHGWLRTLAWRASLWLRYSFWWCLCSLPALGLDLYRSFHIISNELWDIALLFGSYLLWVGGGIAAFILCSRYQSAVYLLPYSKQIKQLFNIPHSDELQKNNLKYVTCFPLFILVIPYFYAAFAFRTEQARLVRRQKSDFIKRNSFSPCKVQKVMIE